MAKDVKVHKRGINKIHEDIVPFLSVISFPQLSELHLSLAFLTQVIAILSVLSCFLV